VLEKMVLGFPVTFLPPDPSDPTAKADPNRDPHDGRWFADLDIGAEDSYFPLLRLALARVQPNGLQVSPAVIANIVPLTPNRTITVVADPAAPNGFRVTVVGPGPIGGISTRIVVTPQLQPSPGLWVSLPDVNLDHHAGPAGARSGSIALPTASNTHPIRLLIRESEKHATDFFDQERLVFAELVAV
jgi:hypothetical protein